ncbi:testican-1-like [Chaetodon auriga]|uniref:testican-1-like n=1 Tax=Chaetodon auriga TaxID=39042 RepID=UPI004032ED95
MFNKPDMIVNLLLDQSELSAIYLNEYELYIKSLFNSCASIKDGLACPDEAHGEQVTLGDFGIRRDVIVFVDQEKESQNE